MAERHGISEQAVFASLPGCADSADRLVVAEMREKCLNGFMRCLPSKQRIAFTLRVILELPLRDAAEIMDTTENNVKVLTHRARKFMQALMENRCSFLKPDNPCKCSIWVGYAMEHGILKKEQAHKLNQQDNEYIRFDQEVGILHRIKVLQQLAKSPHEPGEFIKQVKQLADSKKLKILS